MAKLVATPVYDDRELIDWAAAWLEEEKYTPYSYKEMEQAFWHLWTLNCYHITLSFDQNMVLLLDWAVQYHMDWGEHE